MVCDVYTMFFTLIFLNKLKIPKNHEPEIHCCDYIYITDFKLCALFYTMLASSLLLFSWTSSCWHMKCIMVSKDSRFKKGQVPRGKEGRGAKLNPITPGGKHKCQPFNWPQDKRGTDGNNSPNQDWEHDKPTYFLHSHLRESSSDLVLGPAFNGPKTSLVPLLTTELELFKYSRTCMKCGCQADLNKADLPVGYR